MQVRTLAPKEVDYEIPHRREREMSASEDTRPKKEWIIKSHIDQREKRVPAKTLSLEKSGL